MADFKAAWQRKSVTVRGTQWANVMRLPEEGASAK